LDELKAKIKNVVISIEQKWQMERSEREILYTKLSLDAYCIRFLSRTSFEMTFFLIVGAITKHLSIMSIWSIDQPAIAFSSAYQLSFLRYSV
jgi:hypothetical protein